MILCGKILFERISESHIKIYLTLQSLSVVTKAAIAVTVVYILTFSWIQW